MLHRCIEGERVGVDGSNSVDVDRHHDPCPGGTPAPPEERGREPPSFFFFLDLPPRWEESSPLWSMASMAAKGREPLRDWISLSVLFCFAFPRSGPSSFLKFTETRHSNCAEIFTRFFSINYLSCARRRAQSTLEEGTRYLGVPGGAWL